MSNGRSLGKFDRVSVARRIGIGLLSIAGVVLPAICVAQAPSTAGRGPVPLVRIESAGCHTFAPQGWRIIDQNPRGPIFTLGSPDGLMAGYAGAGVNGAQARGIYDPRFKSPESFALSIVSDATKERAQPTRPVETLGYYQVLNFATANHRGYALLYRFSLPPTVDRDPAAYGVMMRIAIGNASDPRSVGVAGAVAAAIACNAVLQAPPQLAQYQPPREVRGTGRSRYGDNTLAGTYNAQLGTGWVHDGAGNNYNVDVARDYHEIGPDGPGYYRRNGNDLIKLQPGLQ